MPLPSITTTTTGRCQPGSRASTAVRVTPSPPTVHCARACPARCCKAGAADPLGISSVGDWINFCASGRMLGYRRCGGATSANGLLTRRGHARGVVRPGAGCLVDVAVVTEGLHPEPDLGRIEQLRSPGRVVSRRLVVLTKADPSPTPARCGAGDVATAALRRRGVLAVSATTGEGMTDLAPYVVAGRSRCSARRVPGSRLSPMPWRGRP